MTLIDRLLESWKKKGRPKTHWTLETEGTGKGVDHPLHWCSSYQIKWCCIQPEMGRGQERIPEEHTQDWPDGAPFTAAGRKYRSLKELAVKHQGAQGWDRDRYGRQVFCILERFPCFDSYDSQEEDRYYRWYFTLGEGRLTRIYHTDGQKTIQITEDVRELERKCYRIMEQAECFFAGSPDK